jgi:hypothetical protein
MHMKEEEVVSGWWLVQSADALSCRYTSHTT